MKNTTGLFLFLLLIISCAGPSDKASDKVATNVVLTSSANEVVLTDDQVKLSSIQVGKIERRQISNAVKANGMLDVPPQNLVTISAPLGGFVKHTELLQGMKVKKGQVIIVLEHPDYIQIQQDYLDSKSQLEYLEEEYKRQQDLALENVNATKTVQQAKSNYFSMKAKVEGLKAKLKMININTSDLETGAIKSTISITSPIDGFVTQVRVNIGMHVNPTDVLFTIVDTEHLHAEAQVFEKDVSKLAIGQTVRLTLTNETKERMATVYLIGKEITPQRTVRVHCHLTDEDTTLIPGMYFNAIIETGEVSTAALPSEAVVNYDGKNFIFVVEDINAHRYKMTEVVTGISEGGYTAIDPSSAILQKSIVVKGTYSLLGILKNKQQ